MDNCMGWFRWSSSIWNKIYVVLFICIRIIDLFKNNWNI